MKKALVGLVVFAGLAAAAPSFAQPPVARPHAARPSSVGSGHFIGGGWYVCPIGFMPVMYQTSYFYTYNVIVGYQTINQPVYGPFGRFLGYRLVNVPITQPQTFTIPGGQVYCVPGGPMVPGPVPGPGPFPM